MSEWKRKALGLPNLSLTTGRRGRILERNRVCWTRGEKRGKRDQRGERRGGVIIDKNKKTRRVIEGGEKTN